MCSLYTRDLDPPERLIGVSVVVLERSLRVRQALLDDREVVVIQRDLRHHLTLGAWHEPSAWIVAPMDLTSDGPRRVSVATCYALTDVRWARPQLGDGLGTASEPTGPACPRFYRLAFPDSSSSELYDWRRKIAVCTDDRVDALARDTQHPGNLSNTDEVMSHRPGSYGLTADNRAVTVCG